MKANQNRNTSFAGILALAVPLLASTGCKKEQPFVLPTPEVFTTQAIEKDVPIVMELVGQTAGSKDVEIRARVEGYLQSVDFTEGDFVKQGQLLYTIDPKPFEAILAQAKAQVATMEAKLSQAELDVARLKPLAEQEAVSRRDYDNSIQNRDAVKGQLDAARANQRTAEINLSYTRITAPISGLSDLTKARPGALVGRGEATLLTTISVIDPIYFDAAITEVDYIRLAEQKAQTGGPAQRIGIDLVLANGKTYPHKGYLDAVERSIDPKTGTLALRLSFPNPDRILRPGQYGRISFVIKTLTNTVCVPQKAVQAVQGVEQIIVVGADNKAEVRKVTMGPRSGELWAVLDGLKAGETVVVEGLQKVKPGGDVSPKPIEKVSEAPAPAPAEAPAPPQGK